VFDEINAAGVIGSFEDFGSVEEGFFSLLLVWFFFFSFVF